MWVNEQSIETTAAPEDVWALWADVAGWPEWNRVALAEQRRG